MTTRERPRPPILLIALDEETMTLTIESDTPILVRRGGSNGVNAERLEPGHPLRMRFADAILRRLGQVFTTPTERARAHAGIPTRETAGRAPTDWEM